jgi:hypothetical protein
MNRRFFNATIFTLVVLWRATGSGAAPVEHAASPPIAIDDIAHLPLKIRKNFENGGDCAGLDAESFKRRGGMILDLSKGNRVYIVPCGDGGAYNFPFMAYAAIGESLDRLDFPVVVDGALGTVDAVDNLNYDAGTGIFSALDKDRFLADCGTYDEWRLEAKDDGRMQFVLLRELQNECDENGGDELEHWPLIWPHK